MESNRRHPEERDSRYREENHRVGQELYRRDQQNQVRHPQERYQSGLNYHNRQEGLSREQTHYGSRPDSAYRNPDINFGDNPYRYDNDYRYDRPAYREDWGNTPRSPYRQDHTRPEQHHDTRAWHERDRYKDDDYRYRSGNRGWGADDLDYEEDDRARHQGDFRGHDRDQGFFDRVGNSISQAWRNMTEGDEDNRAGNYDQRNRPFNRGYESGPRWADESETDRYRPRRPYRDDNDRY